MVALVGLTAFQAYKYYLLGRDNLLCAEMAQKNEENIVAVFGNENERLPWVDHIGNTDPENNNDEKHKKWNLRKVAIAGTFVNKPVLSTSLFCFLL